MAYQSIANTPEYTSAKPYAIFAVIDLELTGLNENESRIVDSAVILCDENGKILFVYETLVNPGVDTGPVHIHHITNEMVVNAPHMAQVADDHIELFNGRIFVGLNNGLDFKTYAREFDDLGIKFHQGSSLDLSDLLRDAKFSDMYEEQIMEAINSQDTEHRALPDAMVAAMILPYALEFAKMFPERVREYKPASVMVQDREPMQRELSKITHLAPG